MVNINLVMWRYYTAFRKKKFETFYKINKFLQKTTNRIGIQEEQIFLVNI